MSITTEHYRGLEAVRLSTGSISIAVVPDYGARIASLRDEKHDVEWLVGATGPVLSTAAYGDRYIEHPLAGWDEMFPSIEPCDVDGIRVPDHGDVWSLPWQHTERADAIETSVRARWQSVELRRTITADDDRSFLLRYDVRNHAEQVVPFLWAAHPLFLVTPSTRLILPGATDVFELTGPGVPPGGRLTRWPADLLDRIGPAPRGDRKFFVPAGAQASEATLQDEQTGRALHLSWNPDDVPYLGVWVDDGRWIQGGTIAIEPMTGYYDSLALAVANGAAPSLAPGGTATWDLRVAMV